MQSEVDMYGKSVKIKLLELTKTVRLSRESIQSYPHHFLSARSGSSPISPAPVNPGLWHSLLPVNCTETSSDLL